LVETENMCRVLKGTSWKVSNWKINLEKQELIHYYYSMKTNRKIRYRWEDNNKMDLKERG
jgi:hypothetical protein